MKSSNFLKIIFGAVLALSSTQAMAQDMKSGAGKYGSSSMMPKSMMKCGGGECCDKETPKTKEDIIADLKEKDINMMMQTQEEREYKRGNIATH